MLDAEPASLCKFGTVTVEPSRISIDGFDANGGSCRDVAALALVWAIGELQRDLMATLESPGGGAAIIEG